MIILFRGIAIDLTTCSYVIKSIGNRIEFGKYPQGKKDEKPIIPNVFCMVRKRMLFVTYQRNEKIIQYCNT